MGTSKGFGFYTRGVLVLLTCHCQSYTCCWTWSSRLLNRQHGAFYTQPILEEYPAVIVPDVSCMEQFTRKLWAAVRALIRCIIPQKKPQTVERALFPAEVWNRILQYDVGRMCFIMRGASQLSKPDTVQREIPNLRFKVEMLDFSSSLIQIHTIKIGWRAYIRHLSNSSNNNHATQSD